MVFGQRPEFDAAAYSSFMRELRRDRSRFELADSAEACSVERGSGVGTTERDGARHQVRELGATYLKCGQDLKSFEEFLWEISGVPEEG